MGLKLMERIGKVPEQCWTRNVECRQYRWTRTLLHVRLHLCLIFPRYLSFRDQTQFLSHGDALLSFLEMLIYLKWFKIIVGEAGLGEKLNY